MKIKNLLNLVIFTIISCVQKENYLLDPTTVLGFNLQYNLCGILKICTPKLGQAPIAGDSGKLNFTNISKTSITLNWTLAIDDNTPQTAIQYLVYYSTKDDISVLADIKANGTQFDSFVKNINTKTITGLNPSIDYYFNLIAMDQDGNQTVYLKNNTYTLNDKIVLFSYQFTTGAVGGGRIGADSLCLYTRKNLVILPININCNGVRAFISFNGDNIVDMATKYLFDSSLPIVSPTNIRVANNWNDLTTGNSILNSMITAQVSYFPYWTFTKNSGGVVDTSNTCIGGTESTALANGIVGDHTAKDLFWINKTIQSCNNIRSLLCICF